MEVRKQALQADLARAQELYLAGDIVADPLTLLREINTRIYDAFEYVPESTRVDSPIDHALERRQLSGKS